jgi:protein-tyrosine phosphatase
VAEQRLLFVCLGNICRSPAAEGMFLHLVAQEGLEDQFLVDSAGTGGWHAGNRPDRRMRAAAERRGIHLPSRARQIQPADLTSFDRILTMDANNLQAVRSLAAAELSGDDQERAIIEPMTSHCRRFRDAEVPDPYYGGEAGFEHVLDLLEDACSGLLATLRLG